MRHRFAWGLGVWAIALTPALSPALAAPAAQAPPKAPSAKVPAASKPAPALEALLKEAAERHPGVHAAHARYQAARARVGGEGLRPDPMVEAGVMSLIGLMGPQLTVAQTFPLGGKLELARAQAEREAEVAKFTYMAALNDLAAQVKTTYYALYAAQQGALIVERNKVLIQQMGRIAGARYAVGQGKQADVVRTQSQLAEMLHEAVLVRQARERASVTLMGLLNRSAATTHVHAFEGELTVPPVKTATEQTLEAALAEAEAHNPEIAMARAEVAVAEAALAAAHAIAVPDLTARVGVAQSYMDMGWRPVVTAMVGTNVPLESRKREEAATAAAVAELAARLSTLDDRRRAVRVGLVEALTHVRHLEEQADLYAKGLLPQSRQALASELANYQVGRSDFDAVIAAQMSLFRYEREERVAIADYHTMRAEIDRLTGRALAQAPKDLP